MTKRSKLSAEFKREAARTCGHLQGAAFRAQRLYPNPIWKAVLPWMRTGIIRGDLGNEGSRI